jgi:hypothetical protein
MATITVLDKLECIERELKYRRFVYPKWIANNKMAQHKADREIAVMESIRDDYKRSAEPDLFGSNTED